MKAIDLLVIALFLAACGCSSDRTPVWQWKLESRSYADPVIDQNKVYIVSQAGEVIAGEYLTGKVIWKRKIDGSILAAPAVSKMALFTATENGNVYALDKLSGNDIWKKHLKDSFLAPLSVASELVILPSGNGTLRAIFQSTGDPKWENTGNKKYNTRAVVSNGYILIGGWGSNFYCVRMDGTTNWTFKTGGILVEEATIFENSVFFSGRDNHVYGLEISTGKLLWRFPVSSPTRTILVDNKIVFGDDRGTLYSVQPENGNLIKKITVRKQISQLYPFGKSCIVVSRQAYEINPNEGRISPLISLPEPIFKMTISNQSLVVTDELYSIYGFRM